MIKLMSCSHLGMNKVYDQQFDHRVGKVQRDVHVNNPS